MLEYERLRERFPRRKPRMNAITNCNYFKDEGITRSSASRRFAFSFRSDTQVLVLLAVFRPFTHIHTYTHIYIYILSYRHGIRYATPPLYYTSLFEHETRQHPTRISLPPA